MSLARIGVVFFLWWVILLLGAGTPCLTGDVSEDTALVEIAPGWMVQAVVPSSVLQHPKALAFDRFGALWVVDGGDTAGRLIRCPAATPEGRWTVWQEVPTVLDRVEAVSVWGDWIYLAGPGEVVRYGLSPEGLKGEAEVVLQGPQTKIFCLSATPAGVWLGVSGSQIIRAGHKPILLPRFACCWVLLPHDSRPPLLVCWDRCRWCGPAVADMDGRLHWLDVRDDGSLRWNVWNPRTGLESRQRVSWSIVRTEDSPGEESVYAAVHSLRRLAVPFGPNASVPAPVLGPVLEYVRSEGGNAGLETVRLWAQVWPAQLLAESADGKREVRLHAKSHARARLGITALANSREGFVYVAGRYQNGQGKGRGFIWRLQPNQTTGRLYYTRWRDLAGLRAPELVERLKSDNPWETQTAQEEIGRRGTDMVSSLLEFAKLQAATQGGASEGPPYTSAAISRAMELVGLLNAPAGRTLALNWVQSDSPTQIVAALAVLGRLRDAETLSALVRLLGHRDEHIRRAAALALGEQGTSEAAVNLVQCLRFYDNRDPGEFQFFARGLECCGAEGLAALAELLDAGSAHELTVAWQAWLYLRHAEALRYLEKFVNHPHLQHEQRRAILRWWADLATHYPANSKPILDWVEKETGIPAETLAEAVRALSVAPTELSRLGATAERLLGHESVAVRIAAVSCLRAAKHTSAREKLLPLVWENARSTQERLYAAETLLYWRDRDVCQLLLRQLPDNFVSATLREHLAALLLVYGDSQVKETVLAHLRLWPAEMFRESVQLLRWDKETLLLLAEACLQNKLKVETCGPAVLELLGPWAWSEPSAESLFHRLAERCGQPSKELR